LATIRAGDAARTKAMAGPTCFFLFGDSQKINQEQPGLLRVSVFDLYKLLSCCGSLFVLSLSLAVVFAGLSLFHKNGKCNFSN
jgi:hypothetical protein